MRQAGEEGLQRLADAGAAVEVADRSAASCARAASSPRRRSAAVTRVRRVPKQKVSTRARVAGHGLGDAERIGLGLRLHRAGDVDQQEQPSRPDLAGPAQEAKRLAEGAARGAAGAAQVEARARAGRIQRRRRSRGAGRRRRASRRERRGARPRRRGRRPCAPVTSSAGGCAARSGAAARAGPARRRPAVAWRCCGLLLGRGASATPGAPPRTRRRRPRRSSGKSSCEPVRVTRPTRARSAIVAEPAARHGARKSAPRAGSTGRPAARQRGREAGKERLGRGHRVRGTALRTSGRRSHHLRPEDQVAVLGSLTSRPRERRSASGQAGAVRSSAIARRGPSRSSRRCRAA